FFSSRRRHTSSKRDWSSDVCSSDLGTAADFAKYAIKPREHEIEQVPPLPTSTASEVSSPATRASPAEPGPSAETAVAQPGGRLRSEERRVGKECSSRCARERMARMT